MAKIDGFEVAYTHRGSWKASRSLRGKIVDEIPVAWDDDFSPGNPPSLIVWFKTAGEAELMMGSRRFVAAIARKHAEGASSNDIIGMFEVEPLELVPSDHSPLHRGIRCEVRSRVEGSR